MRSGPVWVRSATTSAAGEMTASCAGAEARLGNTRASNGARFYKAGFVREHDGVDAIAQVELGEDVADVRLGGGLADDELLRDLYVGDAFREEFQGLALAWRERIESALQVVVPSGEPGERLDNPPGHRGGQHGFSL